jgi:hypothetical protein
MEARQGGDGFGSVCDSPVRPSPDAPVRIIIILVVFFDLPRDWSAMSDIPSSPGIDPRRRPELELIQELVDGVIADMCARHHPGETQEHQFTSRIAQAIEQKLNDVLVGGLRLHVVAQELSDRGRSSSERSVGADLYISVGVIGERQFSKGLLIQSKWDDALSRASERRTLSEQSDRMLRHSDESYVWVYRPGVITVVPAAMVRETTALPDFIEDVTTVGGLIADGLGCSRGDPSQGVDLADITPAGLARSLRAKIRELAARTGLGLIVTEPRSE